MSIFTKKPKNERGAGRPPGARNKKPNALPMSADKPVCSECGFVHPVGSMSHERLASVLRLMWSVAPVAPVASVEPVAPVAPAAPVEPVAPVAPEADTYVCHVCGLEDTVNRKTCKGCGAILNFLSGPVS